MKILIKIILMFVIVSVLAKAEDTKYNGDKNGDKIATVNILYVISQSQEANKLRAQYQQKAQKSIDKVRKLEQEIRTMQNKLLKEADTLSTKQKQKIQEEYKAKVQEYSSKSQELQKKEQQDNRAILDKIRPKITLALKEIAEREGYSVILNSEVVHYIDPKRDMTEELIKKLNSKK